MTKNKTKKSVARRVFRILKIFLFCTAGILLIGGGSFLYYYKTHYITATLDNIQQNEITDILSRPDCGWYQLYSYYLQPEKELTADEKYIETTDADGYQYRLSLLEFNIKDYAARPLDAAAKKNIETVLQQFSNTKSKVIIRFLYDWDGQGMANEPSQIKWIKKHMTQAAALLNKYKDCIYTTQGIFVGSWAEMHDSKYLSDTEMTTLLLHFASVTDSSIYLAVRTPAQYRTIFNELEKHPKRYEKYNISAETLKKRLGLFNDGMLGSVSDVGTYHDADLAASSKEKRAIRKKELDFQNQLALRVPNGGEVIHDNPFNDTDSAIASLSKMHISYLNQMYDEEVINKWKQSTYRNDNSLYDGFSTYDYITAHLGARFVLKDCSLSYEPFQEGDATGSITLENVGFSNLYHTKDFTLTLINKETDTTHTLLSSKQDTAINPCHWDAGAAVALPFSFSPFSLEDGVYYLTANLKDSATGEQISFANDSYDDSLGGYCLGKITIQR